MLSDKIIESLVERIEALETKLESLENRIDELEDRMMLDIEHDIDELKEQVEVMQELKDQVEELDDFVHQLEELNDEISECKDLLNELEGRIRPVGQAVLWFNYQCPIQRDPVCGQG